jgi:hypothetical protein
MGRGSHATWGGMPRTCAGCGEKLRITCDTLWLDTMRGESWHMRCKLDAGRAERATGLQGAFAELVERLQQARAALPTAEYAVLIDVLARRVDEERRDHWFVRSLDSDWRDEPIDLRGASS